MGEQLTPYLFPGECGGHEETRWLELASDTAVVRLETDVPMHFSALPCSLAALERAAHPHEIERDGYTWLHLDAAHMGVGGDDSWNPRVHQQYLVQPGVYRWEFLLAIGESSR